MKSWKNAFSFRYFQSYFTKFAPKLLNSSLFYSFTFLEKCLKDVLQTSQSDVGKVTFLGHLYGVTFERKYKTNVYGNVFSFGSQKVGI